MQSQLCVQRADLLAIAERGDSHGAIYVPKLRRFQQRQCRNALACSQLKSVGNEPIVFVAANFYLVI